MEAAALQSSYKDHVNVVLKQKGRKLSALTICFKVCTAIAKSYINSTILNPCLWVYMINLDRDQII